MTQNPLIHVPYQSGNAFVLPVRGKATHEDVMRAIDNDNLLRPTSAQTLALIRLALQNPTDEALGKVADIIENGYFWTSTENLFVPDGIFVYDNLDGKVTRERADLSKRLAASDPSVRFVPYGFKIGNQALPEFLSNPYVIAQFGEDSLGTLEEVIRGPGKDNPILATFNKRGNWDYDEEQGHTIIAFKWGQEGFTLHSDPLTHRAKYGQSLG